METHQITRRTLITAGSTLALGMIPATTSFSKEKSSPKTGFVPPNADARGKALGSFNDLSNELKRAFDPGDDFTPMSMPKPGEWLAEQIESGQSYDQFVKQKPSRPEARRTTIYLLPFGDFDPEWSPAMSDLESCASAFFQVPTKTLPKMPLDEKQFTTRKKFRRRQFLSRDFLQILPKHLPSDGFVILGITMEDLYPDPAWNYVFGQASLRDRTGIYSFARYDPQFFGEKRTEEARLSLLVRSLGVLLHETCHMFGMEHCVYYRCLINGCNSLAESDKTPMHLCPICLRKLHHSVGFNIRTRYEELLKEYVRLEIQEESDWLEKRIKFLKNG